MAAGEVVLVDVPEPLPFREVSPEDAAALAGIVQRDLSRARYAEGGGVARMNGFDTDVLTELFAGNAAFLQGSIPSTPTSAVFRSLPQPKSPVGGWQQSAKPSPGKDVWLWNTHSAVFSRVY